MTDRYDNIRTKSDSPYLSQYSIKHSLYSHPPFVQQKQPETFRPTHNTKQPLPLYWLHDMRSSSKPT